jgi:hypothetical protein
MPPASVTQALGRRGGAQGSASVSYHGVPRFGPLIARYVQRGKRSQRRLGLLGASFGFTPSDPERGILIPREDMGSCFTGRVAARLNFVE